MQVPDGRCFFVSKIHRTHWPALVDMIQDSFQQCLSGSRFFIGAGLHGFLELLHGPFQGFLVGQTEFCIYHLNVTDGIDLPGYVYDVVIIKTPDYLGDGLGFTYVCQELVPQPLSTGGTLYQSGDVDEFHMGRYRLSGFDDGGDLTEAVIRNGYNTDVGIDGAEWIVFCTYG